MRIRFSFHFVCHVGLLIGRAMELLFVGSDIHPAMFKDGVIIFYSSLDGDGDGFRFEGFDSAG
jgi:hypothetical protein